MTTQLPTAKLVEQFHENGYVILKGFLELQIVRQVRSALSGLVEQHAQKLIEAGTISGPFQNEPFETRLLRLYETCLDEAPIGWRAELHLAELFDIFFNPRLLDIVELILGREFRLYPNYTVRPKLPDHPQTLVLWHQDGGYTEHWNKQADGDVSDFRMVNAWTPLVEAHVENGCMQFIAGTHKLGLLPHVQREFYLEIPEEHLEEHQDRIVDVELDPGDLVVFHNMLCHRGLANLTQTIRWSLDWRYQDVAQPTLRAEQGHIARSLTHPDRVVTNAAQWAGLSFG